MIVYYTPPAVTSPVEVAPATTAIPRSWLAKPPVKLPAGPIAHPPSKPHVLAPAPVAATHVTQKGRPPLSWLQASGFPAGVLAADNTWHPNKWVGAGKAPISKAVKTITGLPVSLGVGVAGNTRVSWPTQSRLTCLYAVARQAGVIIEILPHTVRIVSG